MYEDYRSVDQNFVRFHSSYYIICFPNSTLKNLGLYKSQISEKYPFDFIKLRNELIVLYISEEFLITYSYYLVKKIKMNDLISKNYTDIKHQYNYIIKIRPTGHQCGACGTTLIIIHISELMYQKHKEELNISHDIGGFTEELNKKKVGKWVPLYCTLGGGVDLGLEGRLNLNAMIGIIIFEEKFMENLVPNFQNLVIKEKNFMIFQHQNYLQIFAFSTDFIPLTLTFGENFKQFGI
ncbi:hypothetical protein AGLY_014664 [Aphis glycines]|uniref:Uncharacterized protein n=1 Tax=Aphis glycines TaxID=307491 RepID=A0A6G0T338_APHGL|nr:hypothetical protein AGLY_014664 [Aphis glycines]